MLPEIKSILYATDLSDNSVNAFRYAVVLAKSTGAKVHVLHVVEELSNDARVAMQLYLIEEDERKKVLRQRVDQAEKILTEKLQAFWEQCEGPDRMLSERIASVKVSESYPVEAILKSATELGCDIIVMGTHEKGLMRTFLGSVAKSVLHSSRIPVFVVPLPER